MSPLPQDFSDPSTAFVSPTFLRSALSGVEAEVVKAETQAVRGGIWEGPGGLDG